MRNYLVTMLFDDGNGEPQLEQVCINAPDTRYAKSNAWITVLDEYGYDCKLVNANVRRL